MSIWDGINGTIQSWLGTPYLFGGTTQNGVDCSGLTSALYASVGLNIGRTTGAQMSSTLGQTIGQDGNFASATANLRPGDLIFYGAKGASGANAHVVMYVGNGQVVEAAHTGTNVRIVPLYNAASSDEPFAGVRRYADTGASQGQIGTPSGTQANTSTDVTGVIADKFGYMSWAQNIPEIGNLLKQAHDSNWNPAQFEAGLEATTWWQNHSSVAREWQHLQSTDPATAQRETSQKLDAISIQSQQLGIAIQPDRLRAMAIDALSLGWNDSELHQAIMAEGSFGATQAAVASGVPGAGGNISAIMNSLKAEAADQYIPLSDQDAYSWAQKMLTVGADPSSHGNDGGFSAYLVAQAKARFPQYAAELDAGVTAKTIFSPYVDQTSKILETGPGNIDLMNNPQYSRMIDNVDGTGVKRPMTLTEAATYAKGLPQWQNTGNANQAAGALTQSLLTSFGMVKQ